MNPTEFTGLKRPELKAFYDRISGHNLAPLWEVMHGLITPTPCSRCEPAIWHYSDIRPAIMESGDLISAMEAERRVLILENPGLRGLSKITTTLYAGLQLIMPGEIAPAHRHSQTALRFIVEGEGAYTSVEGERTVMRPGDFVTTPNWRWHDHGNETDVPMIWLDGLDIPMVQFFDASFAERYADHRFPKTRAQGDSGARYGNGLLPVDYRADSPSSPIFNYPYARSRESLETLKSAAEFDPCHGIRLKYINPANGGYALPSMATFIQLLPAGFSGATCQSTDATVFSVVEGTGRITVGEQVFSYAQRDHWVVPSWAPFSIRADEESVLFSFSDRPVQEFLGIWREKRH